MDKPREQAIRVSQDSRLKVGDHVIVSEQDFGHGDRGGHTAHVTPYMAEITGWGAHWSEPGRSGYYALTRELPDGERLAREHDAAIGS